MSTTVNSTVGFGVYQVPPPEQAAQAVAEAIAAGYRHIDTAQAYYNEAEVGAGIRASGIDRSQLHVTTKVWIDNYGPGTTADSVKVSLDKLSLDYVDEILLHQPFADVFGAWRDLVAAREEGLVRMIGVSNFTPARLHDLGKFSGFYPMVNQIEINPFSQRVADVAVLQEHGVAVEAWAPFVQGRSDLFSNPLLNEIGTAHGKSAAQVTLRWLLQRGITPLAKSVHADRMAQNIDVFDFELSEQDMARIATLDTGQSQFIDHSTLETVDFYYSYSQKHANAARSAARFLPCVPTPTATDP